MESLLYLRITICIFSSFFSFLQHGSVTTFRRSVQRKNWISLAGILFSGSVVLYRPIVLFTPLKGIRTVSEATSASVFIVPYGVYK